MTSNITQEVKTSILDKNLKRKSEQITSKKSVKRQKKTKKLHEEGTDETEYYFEKGLRKVYPYPFVWSTYTKGRWLNRKLLEVFNQEFTSLFEDQLTRSIQNGRLSVNGKKIDLDYVLKNGDYIEHESHRHEPPVNSIPIKFVFQDENLLVVDKPCGLPVHPTGTYRNNSLTFVLAREHGLKNLCSIYRLDSLTSGLMIFGRNPEVAGKLSSEVRDRNVHKEYFAKTVGVFPSEQIECSQSIGCISQRHGLHCALSEENGGKACLTTFQRLSTDGETSIVKCIPRTGRTHQIRIHLQFLGYPITNDPIYNNKDYWGPEMGKNGNYGNNVDLLKQQLEKHRSILHWINHEETSPEVILKINEKIGLFNAGREFRALDTSTYKKEYEERTEPKDAKHFDPHCELCRVSFLDPTIDDLTMYLHAYKYKCGDWEYSTEIPNWVTEMMEKTVKCE